MSATKRKVYEVVNATDTPIKAIDVGGHTVKFKRNGSALVTDAGVAKELQHRYGYNAKGKDAGKVVVCELEGYNEFRDRGKGANLHYWTMPAMPWHKKEKDND